MQPAAGSAQHPLPRPLHHPTQLCQHMPGCRALKAAGALLLHKLLCRTVQSGPLHRRAHKGAGSGEVAATEEVHQMHATWPQHHPPHCVTTELHR